jgi:hypothetical protein
MKLVTHKSKNLLYRIQHFVNCTVDFQTSYAVLKQTTADTYNLSFKGLLLKGVNYAGVALFLGEPISSVGKFTKTFTTPSTLPDHNTVVFGLNGATNDTTFKCEMVLNPSTTYTFTCNFTNITQGSVSWKDMMLVEGSTAGEYEPYSYNLLDKWQYPATQTLNGVTFTNNGDGTIVVDGMASYTIFYRIQTVKYTYGHIYLLWWIDNNSSSMKMETNDGEKQIDAYTGAIFTSKTNDSNSVYIDVYPSSDPSSVITKPVLYDLTLMYGAGKEPTTVDQFYTDYPELKVSPLGFIELKNLEINNKNIKRLRYATTTRNLFDKSRAIKGFELNNNQGGTIANLTWFVSDYISVVGINTLTISGKVSGGASNCFYDNNHNFISTVNMLNGAFQVPSGATYMRFNGLLTEIDTAQLESGSTATSYVPYGYLDLGIIPSNSGYILNKYNNLSEELLEENIEKDTVNYYIPDKTNILLNKVEGKTNKIVQLLDKSTVNCSSVNDWTVGTGSDTNLRVANGVVSIDGTLGSYSGVHTSYDKPNIIIKGHKYYISILAMCSKNASNVLLPYTYGFSSSRSTLTANEWKNAEKIDTANVSDTTSIGVRYGSGKSSEETVVWSVKKPQFFDLTSMYGFGNEPTTVEQFKKDYPQFFDEKLDGIWNVRTSGISTTGKNLFDISQWISSPDNVVHGTLVERLSNGAICQGNNGDGDASYSNGWFRPMYGTFPLHAVKLQSGTYTLSADYTMIENSAVNTAQVSCHLYGDNNYAGRYFTSVTVGSTVRVKNTYTVEEGHYYPVFTLNSGKVKIENIQIEYGNTATDYEPYTENKIDLLNTQTLNGINGVNDYIEVIDKGNGLYDLKKTQNIDSVDLGSLGYDVEGSNFVTGALGSVIKPPSNDNSVGNYVCQKYVNCALNKSFADGDFGVNSSGYLYFRNSAYTTATAFKTAMNGVILYYQLKTPVTTTIVTNLTYNQVSAVRTNGGLLLVNDNNNQKYAQPNVIIKSNYQYKS